jgi:ribulose-5-phosphate 4-epimerase/fuculose-1-phosphate aldolase
MSENPSSPQTEVQLRHDLAAFHRLVAHFKMTDLIDTHISARIPGTPDHFLINRYGALFEEMRPEDMVKIDLQGWSDGQDAAKSRINLADYTIHSALHEARHDPACVAHTHTPDGIAVSCQAEIKALSGGRPLSIPSSEVCLRAGAQGANRPEVAEIVRLGWDAALRLLRPF